MRFIDSNIVVRYLTNDVFAAHPHLDYADALTVAFMQHEGIQDIYSYDRDFDRIPGVTRRDP